MSKTKLNICYSGSGIHSLRGWATVLIVFSVIGFILVIIGIGNITDSYMKDNTSNIALIIVGLLAILSGCIGAPILRGIASIAETALIQKYLIMKEYNINVLSLKNLNDDN